MHPVSEDNNHTKRSAWETTRLPSHEQILLSLDAMQQVAVYDLNFTVTLLQLFILHAIGRYTVCTYFERILFSRAI